MSRIKGIEIKYPQRSEEWHSARRGAVTGSNAKVVIRDVSATARDQAIRKLLNVKTLTPKVKMSHLYLGLLEKNPKDLLQLAQIPIPETMGRLQYRRTRVAERLTGISNDENTFVTKEMQWGQVNERLAVAKYQMITGNRVTEAFFMLHPEIRCGASPDGNVTDSRTGEIGVLEVKCLESHNHMYKILRTQKMPQDYFVQVQMEMWLSDVDFCDFVAYDSRLPGKLDVFIKRIPRDNNFIDTVLEPEIRVFLEETDRDERLFRMLVRKGFEFELT